MNLYLSRPPVLMCSLFPLFFLDLTNIVICDVFKAYCGHLCVICRNYANIKYKVETSQSRLSQLGSLFHGLGGHWPIGEPGGQLVLVLFGWRSLSD